MTAGLLLLVAIAGGIGAALRLVVDGVVQARTGGRFPWGTLLINVSGSFLLGLLTGLAGHGLPPAVLDVLGTGLLGGYTTFSTASVETVRLLRQGRLAASLAQAVGGLALTVVAALAGLLIAG